MDWRVAKSLLTLRGQIDALAPNRDRSSDGTIGDASHSSRESDHNPNGDGVVTALDITNDPAHGIDSGALAELLRNSKDNRIKYVISNRRIFSSTNTPWIWRPYNGANAHTKHVHISVVTDPALYDDTRSWQVELVSRVQALPSESTSHRCESITATVFGGNADPNRSAYDDHFVTDNELGVALPARVPAPRPKVRVTNSVTQASVDCDIVDVGPWNTNDPYWQNGARPQAESGFNTSGKPTNLAGIDLTPAAARAIGIDGKGKVDWEFVGAAETTPEGGKLAMPVNNIGAFLQQLITAVQTLQQAKQPQQGNAQPSGGSSQPAQIDLQQIITIINAILSSIGKPPLGPVNGALGTAIGNALNGKKTAIGVIGTVLTAIMSSPQISAAITGAIPALAATPVSAVLWPVFLALTGWGVLGKMEKWSQTVAQSQ